MSKSADLFHAPKEYPAAPSDMWYEVPSEKPQPSARPKPIFPWEKTNTARPTRVFDDEQEYQPEQTPSFQELSSPKSPPTPTITVTSSDPWGGFSSKNAWDNDSSIDKYVQGLKESAFRGNIQVLHHETSRQHSPQTGSAEASARSTPTNRKAYKTSDLTSFRDLPSMPVTPAVSYRKPVFWGSDEPTATRSSQLPEAQGVPEQSLWVCPRCAFNAPISELWRMLSSKAASVQAKPQSPPRMKSYASTVVPGASSPPSLSFVPSLPFTRHAASSVPWRISNASPFSRTPSPPSRTNSPEHRRSHPKTGT
jgi:glycogenin glucosyltransferase